MLRHTETCGMRTCNCSTEGTVSNVCIYSCRQRLFNTHKYGIVNLCQSVRFYGTEDRNMIIRYRKNDREIKMGRRMNEGHID